MNPFRIGDRVRCICGCAGLPHGLVGFVTHVFEEYIGIGENYEWSYGHFESYPVESTPVMRTFEGGATRNSDVEKFDFEGFLSPHALEAYAAYMHRHRKQKDGTLRDSDNWQRGIPLPVYVKSMFRHFVDLWFIHRGEKRTCPDDEHELTAAECCCSILFNAMGYLHETCKAGSAK